MNGVSRVWAENVHANDTACGEGEGVEGREQEAAADTCASQVAGLDEGGDEPCRRARGLPGQYNPRRVPRRRLRRQRRRLSSTTVSRNISTVTAFTVTVADCVDVRRRKCGRSDPEDVYY